MLNSWKQWGFVGLLLLWVFAPTAHAQFAVVDVGAITQMVKEIATLEKQLSTAESQLAQANNDFAAKTGNRGMQNLLSGSQRNYLPSSWDQLQSTTQGSAGGFGALTSSFQSVLSGNAVMSSQQAAALSPTQQTLLMSARRTAALAQVLSRTALANSSQRFTALQQLISAIPTAKDQKGILDLHARIAAEQGMLQNEHSKLEVISQVIQAEDRALQQKVREQSVTDVGSFRKLPAMGL
ncbi:MAG TPA: type IV secretion system protein [Steroidobacteraceae bacterium]|jgi:type IV secretion system protein VirB5